MIGSDSDVGGAIADHGADGSEHPSRRRYFTAGGIAHGRQCVIVPE